MSNKGSNTQNQKNVGKNDAKCQISKICMFFNVNLSNTCQMSSKCKISNIMIEWLPGEAATASQQSFLLSYASLLAARAGKQAQASKAPPQPASKAARQRNWLVGGWLGGWRLAAWLPRQQVAAYPA